MLPKTVTDRIQANWKAELQALETLIRIPSVATPAPTDGFPYGKPCAEALDYMLEQLRLLGMHCTCYDYHMGAADWSDTEPLHLGILCHLDVVPADGKGWDSNPFEPVIRDGRIYGRGAIDDKGPAISVLFALRAIREAGIPLTKNVRFLLGCNEENGSTDLEYTRSRTPMPPMVFTPDGSYPLIHLEKGMLRLQFSKQTRDPLKQFAAGTTPNAVPAQALAELLKSFSVSTDAMPQIERQGHRLLCKGVSAHASTPETGDNALTRLLTLLSRDSAFADCKALSTLFPHGCTDGTGLGIACSDARSGALTCICSMLKLENGKLEGCVDIRFPVCVTKETLLRKIQEKFAAYGFSCQAILQSDPHDTPEDTPLVQTLLRVYEEQTGETGQCIAIGGGTYVHDIPGGVAFGMEYPGWDYHMHGENEFLPLEQLRENTHMMAAAILALCAARG